MTVVFYLGKTAKTLSFHHVGFVPFVENQIASLPTLLTPVRPDSLRTHSPVSFTPSCLVGHRPLLTASLRKGWEGRGFKTIPPAVDSFPFSSFEWRCVCIYSCATLFPLQSANWYLPRKRLTSTRTPKLLCHSGEKVNRTTGSFVS